MQKLREVEVSIIGNVWHLDKIAELAFDVRHGPIKSKISKNAFNDSQIVTISSVAFNDWSGLVTMTYEEALHGKTDRLRPWFDSCLAKANLCSVGRTDCRVI